jgi:hypothetical protein
LRPNGKEDLEAYRGSLAIENMLCECNMVWIDATGRTNHNYNASMLLYWKGAWVEGPDITKGIDMFGGEDSCKSTAKGKTHKLDNNTAEIKSRI